MIEHYGPKAKYTYAEIDRIVTGPIRTIIAPGGFRLLLRRSSKTVTLTDLTKGLAASDPVTISYSQTGQDRRVNYGIKGAVIAPFRIDMGNQFVSSVGVSASVDVDKVFQGNGGLEVDQADIGLKFEVEGFDPGWGTHLLRLAAIFRTDFQLNSRAYALELSYLPSSPKWHIGSRMSIIPDVLVTRIDFALNSSLEYGIHPIDSIFWKSRQYSVFLGGRAGLQVELFGQNCLNLRGAVDYSHCFEPVGKGGGDYEALVSYGFGSENFSVVASYTYREPPLADVKGKSFEIGLGLKF